MKTDYEFETVDEAFEMLYEFDTNSPHYSIVQGGLYDNLRSSAYVSEREAAQVSRLLNKGEIEEAETMVNDLLEEEDDN